MPRAVLNDLDMWWKCLLHQTVTCSLIPRKLFDPNLHVDASSLYGLSFVIENKYAGWQLITGWACDG